jgi:hypothetical protein
MLLSQEILGSLQCPNVFSIYHLFVGGTFIGDNFFKLKHWFIFNHHLVPSALGALATVNNCSKKCWKYV